MFFTINHTDDSRINQKQTNQDFFLWLEGKIAGGVESKRLVLAACCDGVSKNHGDLAIQLAQQPLWSAFCHIAERAFEDDDAVSLERALVNALESVNSELNKNANLPVTTCSIFLLLGNEMFVANTGDSPVFAYDNTLHELYQCHNAVGDALRAGMSEEAAATYYDANCLTGGLGGGRVMPRIHVTSFCLTGETLILLGSDGALATMLKDEIAALISDYPFFTLDEIRDRILDRAKMRTKDNQSLVLWHIDIE